MNKPKIRFKGFEGEWKKVKIGDVAPLTGGFAFQSGQFKTSGVPIIRISNILSSGIVGGDFVYYNEFKGDSEFRLYKGDVVIAMSGATTGKVATFEANDFGYQNQRVGKFSRTNLVNYELLSKLVSAPNFQKKIISKLTSSAQPNASSKDIDSIDLVVPEETEEQRALASYFTSLDAQIAASTSRLSSLKQIKAASLLNMFPQKGETVPRVRFKGFQGEWNSPSIEDVFEIRNGYTPSKSVESYWIGGTIPWFRMEDIRASGGFLEDSIQHITPKAVKNNGLFEKDSIIMATTATIGVHAQLIANSLANQRFTNFSIRKSLREGIIAKYVYYAFFGIDEWAIKNTNSGGLLSVNMPLLLKQPFFVPSLPEQRAIASYFTALDAQITLHRERLEKLKQIKAACLEKMFA